MNGEGLDISESSPKLIQTGSCCVTEEPTETMRAGSEASVEKQLDCPHGVLKEASLARALLLSSASSWTDDQEPQACPLTASQALPCLSAYRHTTVFLALVSGLRPGHCGSELLGTALQHLIPEEVCLWLAPSSLIFCRSEPQRVPPTYREPPYLGSLALFLTSLDTCPSLSTLRQTRRSWGLKIPPEMVDSGVDSLQPPFPEL